jgi:uncharacterized membrane protein
MEKMLVIIFDKETKAYEGSRALVELDREGSITIHAAAVVEKKNDGTVSYKTAEGDFPIRTFGGTAIGSLIGLLGGPVGFGVGAAVGATAGVVADIYVAGVNEEFLADVAKALTPGKFALVADVSEEWVTPVDVRMETLGGIVFRKPKEQYEEERWNQEVADLRAEINQFKLEFAQARAERKAKLQAKIDELNQKLDEKVDRAKQRSEQLKKEADAKVKALQAKAASAERERKTAIDNRITEIRNKYYETEAKMRNATVKQLREAAAKLEKAG